MSDTQEKLKLMNEVAGKILGYLGDEKDINEAALKAFEASPIAESNDEIKKMREIEASKLRDRIYELNRHIAVIRRMYP